MRTTPGRPRVGYLVDIQNDFMRAAAPGGRLYVKHLQDPADPGAEQIIPALATLARWMQEHCRAVIFSGDWHAYGDREISVDAPDFRTTYPPHCMGRSPDPAEREGAEIIAEARPDAPMLVLDRDDDAGRAREVAADAASGTPVFIRKDEFSVWTGNRAVETFLDALAERLGGRPEFVTAGVASDVCNDFFIVGALERGYGVTVVTDAIHSLGTRPDDEILRKWTDLGARTTTLAALLADAPAPKRETSSGTG